MRTALLSVLLFPTLALADMDPFMGDPGPPQPRPPQPVKPAAEVANLGKTLAGAWKCKGVTLHANGSSTPIQATYTTKLDVGTAWLATTIVDLGATSPRAVHYRTYDAIAKQWTRVGMAATSGYTVATSLGEAGGAWVWTGTETSPTGTLQVRETEQLTNASLKLRGEAMLSGSWQKLYEVTCTK